MSRYIDADEFLENNKEFADREIEHPRYQETVRELINEAPSIDIVRCGECIHNGSYDTDCPFGWKNGEWNLPKPCDFCSYGEREGE